ncbi:MAG: hypothetical protein [Arizlama microvirus]|nr:MAG: hypothetical protein [Arizlama microvirus]
MDWIALIILILNTAVTVLSNMTINKQREQSRNSD